MNNTILNDINQIEELTLEAEMSVINALCECYEKQAMILEYSTSEDVSEFSIFQEGFNDVVKEAKGNKGEHIVIRILKFIPRLVMGLVKMIRSKWGGKDKIKQLEDDIAALKKINVEYGIKIRDLQDDAESHYKHIKRINDNANEAHDRINRVNEELWDQSRRIADIKDVGAQHKREMDKQKDSINQLQKDIDDSKGNNFKKFKELNKRIDVAGGVVRIPVYLDKTAARVKRISNTFNNLAKFDFENGNIDDIIDRRTDEGDFWRLKGYEISDADVFPSYENTYNFSEFVSYAKQLNSQFESITKISNDIIPKIEAIIEKLTGEIKKEKETMTPQQRLDSGKSQKRYDLREMVKFIQWSHEHLSKTIDFINNLMKDCRAIRNAYEKYIPIGK